MNALKASLLLIAMSILVQSSENKRKKSPKQDKKLKLPSKEPHMILSQNLLQLTEGYLMPQDSVKMTKIDKQMRKIIGPENLYPNESPVQVFRHRETNAILWEDSQNLIDDQRKQKIGRSLQEYGNKKSKELFKIISSWSDYGCGVRVEAKPFVRELMFTVCDMDDLYAPLKLAVHFDAVNAIEKLIERGVNVNRKDPFPNDKWPSVLHYASYKGRVATCKLLLQRDANVNFRCSNGCSPILHAIDQGKLEAVKILLFKRAEISEDDKCVIYCAPAKVHDWLWLMGIVPYEKKYCIPY